MLCLTKYAQPQKHVALIGGISQAVILTHDAAANQLFNHTIKSLHAFGFALFHGIEQGLTFRLAAFDVLAGSRSCFQNLDCGDPAIVVGPWQKALGNDEPKRLRQSRADDLLFVLGENADDSFDSFRRIDSMQRRKHEVTSLSRLKGNFHGLAVTHLADEDDLRSLPQRRAQSESKVGCV